MVRVVTRFLSIAVAAMLACIGGALANDAVAQRPETNFRLNCSGCHLEDGSGKAGLVPALAGSIGTVFSVAGGREYIGRIPGVTNSFMNDEELSEVLNWMLQKFDPQHLPSDFRPYTAAEVGRLRKETMSNPMVKRAALMGEAAAVADVPPAQPPQAFALCGACHPTTPDGVNSIGPNLRGIVGRTSGTAPGFMYSSAMKNAKIVWGPDTLGHYLASPATAVPGNAMTYRGEPDPSARSAIVEYLRSLR
jgi:cytochrome c2/mono/diheme cytochrome c family protein